MLVRRCLAACAVVVLPLLGGCVPQAPDRSEAEAACRAEVGRVYNAQNRYQLSERDESSAPLASTGPTMSATNALSDRFAWNQDISNCLAEHTGTR